MEPKFVSDSNSGLNKLTNLSNSLILESKRYLLEAKLL